MILAKKKFDCYIKERQEDEQARFSILKGVIQGYRFVFVNIYSPNTTKDQCIFFEAIQKTA